MSNYSPDWFAEAQAIDWSNFTYVYNQKTDVLKLLHRIINGSTSEAIQADIALIKEVEHQDFNEPCAAYIIPFYAQMIIDDDLAVPVLDGLSHSLSILVSNLSWLMIDKIETPHLYASDDICNNFDFDHALSFLNLNYTVLLDRFNAKKSYVLCGRLADVLTNIMLCERVKNPEVKSIRYLETVDNFRALLNDEDFDEPKKTNLVLNLMELAKYDASIISLLRGWGEKHSHEIWVERCLAYEITEFKKGEFATDKEKALRATLSICDVNGFSRYLPHDESRAIWKRYMENILRYENITSFLPFMKRFLKLPY